MRHKIARFYHVLSVSVVPSVSVESAMESNEVLNDVFLRCVLSGRMTVCHICATRRNRLWRPRKPLACGPKHCRFSRTSHGCLPTFCDTRESKVPAILRAILRDWQGDAVNRIYVSSSSSASVLEVLRDGKNPWE